MTLSNYIGQLSLGSAIQTRANAESQQRERRQVESLRRMEQNIIAAEIDTVSTISTHDAPSEKKVKIKENIVGIGLMVGTTVANYTFCFPIVAIRHRLQTVPNQTRPALQYLIHTYHTGGFRSLYPGFGLGLISQTIRATYDIGIHHLMSPLKPSLPARILTKLLSLLITIPLYPFHRNALILRVQADTQVIRDLPEFGRLYRRDLLEFGSSRVLAAYLPSCLLNLAAEKFSIAIYRAIYQAILKSSHDKKKKKAATVLQMYYPDMVAGVVSSIAVRALIYPVDTVIYRLMIQGTGVLPVETDYSGFWDCLVRTFRKEGGWRAFYRGWDAGLLEILVCYGILEVAWLAYSATQWNLHISGTSDTRAVRKARKLKERFS